MAYAAVISLKQTIHRLLNSPRISIVPFSLEILQSAYTTVLSLKEVLERLNDGNNNSRKRMNDGSIREAVHKLEDVLESHVSNKFLSQSETLGNEGFPRKLSLDMEEVRQEIYSLAETMKKMEEDYIKELENPYLPDEADEAVASSIDDSEVKMVVGLSDCYTEVKTHLLTSTRPVDFVVFSIVGMAGTGRTLVGRALFEELYIDKEQPFDYGAWVTVGQRYQFKEILLCILSQVVVQASNDDKLLVEEGDEKLLGEHLYTILKGRRYMIVLDDIWDTYILDLLSRSFPEQNNGSLVLLTANLREVVPFANSFYFHELAIWNEQCTWDALRLAMFNEESCPPELEEAGKKIAKNCRGLPIVLTKVIVFLCQVEKTPEYWNKVAADKENSIFKVADEISEVYQINEDLQLCNPFLDFDEWLSFIQMVSGLLDISKFREEAKMELFPQRFFPKMEILSILGMAGIGKTTFAHKIFEDPSISCRFDYRAWVTLGPEYQSEKIMLDILAQIYPDIDKLHMKGDEELAKDLCAQLSDKRCLIVLDDIWNKEPLHFLKKSMA